jgi:hypothetical protein
MDLLALPFGNHHVDPSGQLFPSSAHLGQHPLTGVPVRPSSPPTDIFAGYLMALLRPTILSPLPGKVCPA